MNKKVFNTVLLFTGSVLLGIILLQVLWLNNLTKVRTQELRSNTQQALSATVAKLQNREHVSLIMDNFNELIPDTADMRLNIKLDSLQEIETIHAPDTLLNLEPLDSLDDMVEMLEIQKNNLQRTIVFNSTMINKVNDKVKSIDSLVHKMVFELDSWPLGERVDPDTLKQILTDELKNRGININYEFAIFKGDSMIAKSENFIEPSALMRFDIKLYPDDIFDKDLNLVMYYPASSSAGYVFSKMKTFLILTGVFTLGILIAFYLTIRTIKKQKKLGDMKNDFINNITHEFKTPIATSSIAIAALANDQVRTDPDKFNYYTDILKEENSKMNLQVEKVLQMAMMEKGKIEMALQDVNIHETLTDSIKGFELIFRENGINISSSLEATKYHVNADSFHIKHVFNNIIDNAVKYKNENAQLSIETHNKESKLVISFKDNGIGMSAEVQKNSFDKFYRGQKGDLHEVKGFGLGLSYAKSIVELTKGTIELNSHPGIGTEVVISLPLA